MKVFVCGASGFIGSALCRRLIADGHEVARGVRTPRAAGDVAIDFSKDTAPEAWMGRLAGVDAVVNAAGIIVETRSGRFDDVHHRVPAALFAACAQTGVNRFIQISALGADGGETGYYRTKFAADRTLMALPLRWTILRPSLVYGEGGESSRMFRTLASLPIIPVPSLGTAVFQPVHVDDVAEAVSTCLRVDDSGGRCIDVVGAEARSYRDMIDTYRRAMGFGRGLYVTIPAPFMAMAALASGFIPGAPLNPETWRMLKAGSAGDTAGMARLIGRLPRGMAEFIEPKDARRLAASALKEWRPRVLQIVAVAAAILVIYLLFARRAI